MTLRIEIAEREIRAFLSDRLTNRGMTPEEVSCLAKLREALALMADAKMGIARVDMGSAHITRRISDDLKQKLNQLDKAP